MVSQKVKRDELFLFYGDMSLKTLAKLLPFEDAEVSNEEKQAMLLAKAHALTVGGRSRVYRTSILGQPCATLKETPS